MGKTRESHRHAPTDGDQPLPLQGYPPSPSSTSSSDFEFTVSMSPRKGGGASLCAADELFYKGQLLPLHQSPRLSMVRSLLLASSSTSSCSDTTASRDSSGSSNDSTVSAFSAADALAFAGGECDSSRPSSVTEEDATRVAVQRLHHRHKYYFSSLATRFSSVFHRKSRDAQQQEHNAAALAPLEIGSGNDGEAAAAQVRISSSTSGRRSTGKSGVSASSAKDVFQKYLKKVKPLYEKLEKLSILQQHRNHQQQQQSHKSQTAARQELRKKTLSFSVRRGDRSALDRAMMSASASRKEREVEEEEEERHGGGAIYAHSFSGNLRFLQRRQCAAAAMSCPSSMRSSPSHSDFLYPRERGYGSGGGATSSSVDPAPAATLRTCRFPPSSRSSSSSTEELQSAIQGAIAHCKSTMPAQSSPGKASNAASEQI